MQVKRVTLADGEDMPTMVATVQGARWNGAYVPVTTFATLLDYWQRTAQADPNGEWANTMPFVGADGEIRIPAVDAFDDRAEDMLFTVQGDGTYVLDGLMWQDPAPLAHHHTYRADLSDWWCTTCATVTDYCTDDAS